MQSLAQQIPGVARLHQLPSHAAAHFLSRYGMSLMLLPANADIPGSYWGAPEAGLIGNTIYARPDTPVHSILHTACHWICMGDARRAAAHTDAGGDDVEEVAVCYLQCLLADQMPEYSRDLLFADMDSWGYNFRYGSARAWFESDAEDAREWLRRHGLPTQADGIRNLSKMPDRPITADKPPPTTPNNSGADSCISSAP